MQSVNVYSILDSKAKSFNMPFFAPNHSVAFRVVERSMRNPQGGFSDFPADFTLFKVGQFDMLLGMIVGLDVPENLGNLVQFMPSAAPADQPPLSLVPDRATG